MLETRPSGAGRWVNCSLAPTLAASAKPQPDSDEAREGTCAAWLAELILNGQVFLAAHMIGEFHANGWEIDAEMAGHVQEYVDMVRARGGKQWAEHRVRLSDKVAGTLDSGTYVPETRTLFVTDLKYGFRLIEADAYQLTIYASALAEELWKEGWEIDRVVTAIYQPRGFHVDGIYREKIWDLRELWRVGAWIAQRAEDAHAPNPIATPGAYCRDCEGATRCQAITSTTYDLFTVISDARHRDMTQDEIAKELQFLRMAKKIVDARTSAVETEALARHMSGKIVPGHMLKERLGKRKFTAPRGAIKFLTGIDPVKEAEMSPAELKAAGASDRQIKALSDRPRIGHKLEPIKPEDLKRQFGENAHGK